MAAKEQALAKLESMQTPEPKRRRTAQEQALAPLQRRLDNLWLRRSVKLEKIAAEFDSEIEELQEMIAKLRGDDEQAPESE